MERKVGTIPIVSLGEDSNLEDPLCCEFEGV